MRYKVKHNLWHIEGICGVSNLYWKSLLDDNEVDINSLQAGELILNHYLDKSNGNKYQALKSYKGVIKNTYLVDRVLTLEKKLKKFSEKLEK